MKEAGKPYLVKIYPPYGRSHQDGHTFGYFGAQVWENDVFEFLGRYCRRAGAPLIPDTKIRIHELAGR